MISLEALPKVIDSSQLTPDLEGTLQYDHPQWIDLRLVSIQKHIYTTYIHICTNNNRFNNLFYSASLVSNPYISCMF